MYTSTSTSANILAYDMLVLVLSELSVPSLVIVKPFGAMVATALVHNANQKNISISTWLRAALSKPHWASHIEQATTCATHKTASVVRCLCKGQRVRRSQLAHEGCIAAGCISMRQAHLVRPSMDAIVF